jgi:phosphatidylinositol phospholipase C epsilon
MSDLGLLTRNSSVDLFEYKSSANLQKKKIFDAIAAASIVSNCAGVDTSKSQVITLATFVKFLETRQMEQHSEDEVKALIQVSDFPVSVVYANNGSFGLL